MSGLKHFVPLALVATLCAGGPSAVFAASAAATDAPLRTVGTTSADGSAGAWTYDSTQLPPGTEITVHAAYPGNGSTVVTLTVKNAVPSREYGAHAHNAACTSDSLAAGGHYQFVPIPPGIPTADPAYANPSNEIWLDFQTNARGNGRAQTIVPWQADERRPMSLVIHATHTGTDEGTAGVAGARLGCMSVPF